MGQFQMIVVDLLSDEGCGVLPKEEIILSNRFIDLGFDSLKFAEFLIHLENRTGKEIPDEILNFNLEESIEQFLEIIFSKYIG
ncbi:acyl carrier protein [Chengkuizengella sediminis]|uniref:acyl carrier protein n=1 Tax=Chengkuizengella sediminis TaxID=1885917 RepID=UPI001389C823|nr:acyl carrier protein [Chengkuizengella sediminis]NDI35957.1 acyl carrier protein [Chengkuizengella sediminis]